MRLWVIYTVISRYGRFTIVKILERVLEHSLIYLTGNMQPQRTENLFINHV